MRDGKHLLLAARKLVGALLALLGDLREIAERLLDARRALAARQVVGPQQQIVVHGLLREDAMSLDHVHQSRLRGFARAGAGQIAAIEMNRAGPGEQAGDRAQQRRLAGAVRPKQRHDFARADGKIDATQDADLAVAGRKAGDAQEGFTRRGRH